MTYLGIIIVLLVVYWIWKLSKRKKTVYPLPKAFPIISSTEPVDASKSTIHTVAPTSEIKSSLKTESEVVKPAVAKKVSTKRASTKTAAKSKTTKK